jgi:hypothetical protein
VISTAELTHAGPRVPVGQSWKSTRTAGLAARMWARARCRADQLAAHVRVPADVRAQTPVEPGERILLFARDSDGGLVVATDRALRYQDAGGWSRHGWEQLTRATWNDEAHTLIVKGTGAGHLDAVSMPAHDGARLAELARERIDSTVLISILAPLAGHRPARVTARRRPPGEELTWQVTLDNPSAADDPAIRAHLDAAVSALRAHIGR